MKKIAAVFVFFALLTVVAALDVNKADENFDIWTYRENIRGSNRWFVLEHKWSDGKTFSSSSFFPVKDKSPSINSYIAFSEALNAYVSHRAPLYRATINAYYSSGLYPGYRYSGQVPGYGTYWG